MSIKHKTENQTQTNQAIQYFLKRFKAIEKKRQLQTRNRRIGSELKFPLVQLDGTSVSIDIVQQLWKFLTDNGWDPMLDSHSQSIIGAKKAGEMNDHLASCETGFSKVEFSLAHTDDLHTLESMIEEIKDLLIRFQEKYQVAFLGYGMQPVTPPGSSLLMKKSRNLFWDKLFGGNDYIPVEEGTDVLLFTISASSQAHIDVTMDETVDAVNVFNALSGPQIALTAHSNIWKNQVDPDYKCAGEILWDRWLKKKFSNRFGVPEKRFNTLADYFSYILKFTPVYIKRNGSPVALPNCPSFNEFFNCHQDICKAFDTERRCGLTPDGEYICVKAEEEDLNQHFTFFWHGARLSRYYTVENRMNDQQPPQDLMVVPALTLGLMENIKQACELVYDYQWDIFPKLRIEAAKSAIKAKVDNVAIIDISRNMVEIAVDGLAKRDKGEESFLDPLKQRLEHKICPADVAEYEFKSHGAKGLVKRVKIQ